jgi:hypothetical protein
MASAHGFEDEPVAPPRRTNVSGEAMKAAVEADPRADVLAYLDRRRCGTCRSPLSAVNVVDVTRSPHSPAFRCWPPHPTCWQLACPGCRQPFTIAVRKAKAWPIFGEITRRSPKPRAKLDA